MGIKQLYHDNLRKLPNKYGDVSIMINDQTNATESKANAKCIPSKKGNIGFYFHSVFKVKIFYYGKCSKISNTKKERKP